MADIKKILVGQQLRKEDSTDLKLLTLVIGSSHEELISLGFTKVKGEYSTYVKDGDMVYLDVQDEKLHRELRLARMRRSIIQSRIRSGLLTRTGRVK